ncbi:hypothetical protein HZH66_014790 [Vespula vulgaris]|uniref:Uncharacterized protein n=1 Tax=Vespula vulgaris TaxID=7454 RepID=A0A834IZX3_VESVU|nr:hypothetical protein HZH66_014790 [Vespula vulgaris]
MLVFNNHRFSRCDDCTQDKRKSWESNWSTERIDIAQGEALAEECHDAIDDELDDETPANQWGSTSEDRVGN